MQRNYDFVFKVVLLGSSGCGKTSLLKRFADDSFEEVLLSTIGVDFKFKSFNLDGYFVKMQLWDTAGQERFRAIVQPYYRDADAAILVIDSTNALSQQEVEEYWLPELKKHAPNCRPWVFISKCDLPHGDYAVDWSKRHNLGWRKVSSKTGEGVGESIEAIVRQLTLEKPRIENTRIVMSLNEFTPAAKKKCCS